MKAVIDEKTKFTLSMVMSIVALAFSIGVAYAKLNQITSLEQVIRNVDQRLSRIEGKLGVQ